MRFTSPIRVSAPGPIPGLHPPSPSILRLPRMKPRYNDRRAYVRGHRRRDRRGDRRRRGGDVLDPRGLHRVRRPAARRQARRVAVGHSLEHLWESGILRFVRITEDERLAASLDAKHLAPAPKCAHRKRPGGREDIGRGRYRYRTNPYGLALRHPKTGPKTPKYVPAEWDN